MHVSCADVLATPALGDNKKQVAAIIHNKILGLIL